MTDCVAAMLQSDEPWPCWKTKTTIPSAVASDSRFSSTALPEIPPAEVRGEADIDRAPGPQVRWATRTRVAGDLESAGWSR
jgi:hypothetical protein